MYFSLCEVPQLERKSDTGKMSPRESQLYGLLARDRRVNPNFPRKSSYRTPVFDNAELGSSHLINPTSLDKPVFGQYALAGPSGVTLRTGDAVSVVERKSRDAADSG